MTYHSMSQRRIAPGGLYHLRLMKKCSLKNKRILITCGPTWVPVDTMRVISNQSTGTLGQMIAEGFAKAGAKVTLLEGPVTRQLKSKSVKVLKFVFFDEFDRKHVAAHVQMHAAPLEARLV